MPAKLQINGIPNTLGFSVTTSDSEIIIEDKTVTVVVQELLTLYQELNLCRFHIMRANTARWPEGGTKFHVTTSTRQIALGLSRAVQLVDNIGTFL